uniref:Uncharacterized protein n=1 Tax=Romanomermis culicivorax TaxID=13658 RepID=A0A915ITB6_ROMCU
MFKSVVVSPDVKADVKGIKEQEQQQIFLVAKRNNISEENKSHKDKGEGEDARISPQDKRDHSKGVEVVEDGPSISNGYTERVYSYLQRDGRQSPVWRAAPAAE